MAYILTVGGELKGPAIAAPLSIVGFAAFGKHPRNFAPIIAIQARKGPVEASAGLKGPPDRGEDP